MTTNQIRAATVDRCEQLLENRSAFLRGSNPPLLRLRL